ncbi:MAG: exo-alpha-sialidase, partial [Solirubrobacterales bacterium]|nr:exo-alpha-sialidase [Solirubrobacterales bacterium]
MTPSAPAAWTGPAEVGHNEGYDPTSGLPCGDTAADRCDETLLHVDAGDFYATSGGGVEIGISGYSAGADFDLYVYRSDAAGSRGELVAASAGVAGVFENVAIPDADGDYLVRVIYWDVDPAESYDANAAFFRRAKDPPVVDDPAGLPDALASDPARGIKSHSEPHIAQNPTKAGMLVAGSKMYDTDRDSLAEYEFKIGTYVSFDHGRHWTDLGQLNTCPQEQAPPSTWPLGNTCYPANDPALAGTGPEDATDGRPDGDYGEEYTTSDVWVDFDDEGNAYAMVLDDPGFPSGAGWGMSFHRWSSVSRFDVQRGRTWSNRIPINAYPSPPEQDELLDDKNTFAVNNAGKDHDGKTGIIVACWTRNEPFTEERGPQEIVCERSTDGGRTWPGTPQAASPPEQRLVIGVDVVADKRDDHTFYLVWNDYFSGLVSGSGTNTMQVAKSTDGGLTWSAPVTAAEFVPLPNVFPRESFRNLSLPIMDVDRNGKLYLTYSDYNPATAGTPDADGLQADVKLVTSVDGGMTWGAPVKVNQDETNADQFQPYVRVAPNGQVNVSYFDRRMDAPDPPTHPGNFFIDTFLSRSDDGGATFTDERVSHEMWDPTVNPPISPSGQFIGDYQGLVADDCVANPFVNDTHLAKNSDPDPGFDAGKPASPYQEVFTWLVWSPRAFELGPSDCLGTPVPPRERLGVRARAARRAATARATRATRRVLARAAASG